MDPLNLVEQCYDLLPDEIRQTPWLYTGRGKKILESENELNAYIAAYGEMHVVKCRASLQNFPFEELSNFTFEIFDWGCGQGLATLTLLDMLYERKKLSRLKRITLVEPSIYALERAKGWIERSAGPGVRVDTFNTYIPGEDYGQLDNVTCESRIAINLFSNILDIPEINLSWLARKTASLASKNFMICVGPMYTTRITDFCGYFNPSSYFSSISMFPYRVTTRTKHPYGVETKCFIHNRETKLSEDYVESGISFDSVDPYDYTSEYLKGVLSEKVRVFYNRLRECCGDYFKILLKPLINCDSVDFILTNKDKGIYLINVCDDTACLEEQLNKLMSIKENLFSIHLRKFRIDSILQKSIYGCVKLALFFPNSSPEQVSMEINNIVRLKTDKFKLNQKNQGKDIPDFSKDYVYLIKVYETSNLKEIFPDTQRSIFKQEYYDELISIISSSWHSYKDGDENFRLNDRQREFVRNDKARLRIKGVAGSGKTQVVANRAVEQHLKTGDRVLIITFNLSLIQYIRMRILQVPADFAPEMFEIINYHQFFKSKSNLYASSCSFSSFDDASFFEPFKEKIIKYKTIIIDEVQDFKEQWIRSIVTYFLAENGSITLFGDGEQNIYDRITEDESKMPKTPGFSGKWNEMKDRISMRIINPKIAYLSSKFAKEFVNKDMPSLSVQLELTEEQYYINHWLIDQKTKADILERNIRWIINEYNLDVSQVTVLGQSINILRDIVEHYERNTSQSTMMNFESPEEYYNLRHFYGDNFGLLKSNLDSIRRVAKTHFTTACPEIKFSTIHSFKGWESKSIILILQPCTKDEDCYDGYTIHEQENTPALIYTALTRARCNLFILNMGNKKYEDFFKNNII